MQGDPIYSSTWNFNGSIGICLFQSFYGKVVVWQEFNLTDRFNSQFQTASKKHRRVCEDARSNIAAVNRPGN